VPDYVGEGHKLHMLLNFHVNPALFASLATGKAAPLARAIQTLATLPVACQWANFLRNHDELDLGRIGHHEREAIYAAFAPEPRMRLYDRGVRRRLASMLGGDRRRLELAWSLMLSMPGTPVMYYGDEIGMGDELALRERESVRTPMQWSDHPNGGFSTAAPSQLVRPAVDRAVDGFECVNVASQERDPDSLLAWVRRAIRLRQTLTELRWGQAEVVESAAPELLVLRVRWRGGLVLSVHNLSPERLRVPLAGNLARELSRATEVFYDRRSPPLVVGPSALVLEGYGYRWLRM
jgi:maltose alpha-D-glucosyltransferase / alpha-amylase